MKINITNIVVISLLNENCFSIAISDHVLQYSQRIYADIFFLFDAQLPARVMIRAHHAQNTLFNTYKYIYRSRSAFPIF